MHMCYPIAASGHIKRPSRARSRDRFSPKCGNQDVAPGVEEEAITAQRMEGETESRLEEEAAPASWMESETAVVPGLAGERRAAPGMEDRSEPPLCYKTDPQ